MNLKLKLERMAAFAELRKLTVAHQVWGECRWCDQRFEKIMSAASEGCITLGTRLIELG